MRHHKRPLLSGRNPLRNEEHTIAEYVRSDIVDDVVTIPTIGRVSLARADVEWNAGCRKFSYHVMPQLRSECRRLLFPLTDGHALDEYRADTVRNLDAWYPAFDVKPGQKLYLDPPDRVRVW